MEYPETVARAFGELLASRGELGGSAVVPGSGGGSEGAVVVSGSGSGSEGAHVVSGDGSGDGAVESSSAGS